MKKAQPTELTVDQLQQKIVELEAALVQIKQAADNNDEKWKRALADYQNLVKRTQEERKDLMRFSTKEIIEKLLPIIDDLYQAAGHLQDQGLNLAIKKIEQFLEKEGVVRIETINKPFTVETMEAIQVVDGEKDNIVIQETRAGYLMHGSVLRPAQVIVSKKTK